MIASHERPVAQHNRAFYEKLRLPCAKPHASLDGSKRSDAHAG